MAKPRISAKRFERETEALKARIAELEGGPPKVTPLDIQFDHLIDALRAIQSSKDASRELALALTNCEQAQHWVFAYLDRIAPEEADA